MSSVRTGICKGVMHVVLHRPERRNALSTEMCSLLCEALDRAARDEGVKVVMLSGAAGDFAGGADPDADAMIDRFIDRMAAFPKPLVAAVEGLAARAGAAMLLHCDVVYASEDAHFDLPLESLLPGSELSAADAARLGFVTRLLPPSDVLYYGVLQAERLAQSPSGTMAGRKSGGINLRHCRARA